MYEMLTNVGLVLAVGFVVLISLWAWMVIAGTAQAGKASQRKQQLQDEQVARARDEVTKRYQ